MEHCRQNRLEFLPFEAGSLVYNEVCSPVEQSRLSGKDGAMAKIIRCRDVGVDCDFEARGETEQEIMKKAAEHAKSAHNMDEIPPELVAKVRSAIHDE